MTWALNDRQGFPPGGYPYEQTDGIAHSFPGNCHITSQAKRVSEFRAGNGLPRASYKEALADIIAFTCARLGGQEPWCYQVNIPVEQTSEFFKSTDCGGCGANV